MNGRARALSIVSVCRSLPTPADPSGGIFVHRRIRAMAELAAVRTLQPVPYFPLARALPGWAREPERMERGLAVRHAPMLYLPGMLKALDAGWLARAIAGPLHRLHRERPIDLIDAHFGYPEGVGCLRVARRLGIPCFITLRGFENEFIHRPAIGAQMRRSWQQADGIVSVSHSLRRVALEQGTDPERVAVIHNAIDRRLFDRGDRDAARRALGIPPAAPLIVSVGHLIERKRHAVLVRAFASLRERHPDARLAIVGSDGPEPACARRLRAGIEAQGLGGSVHLAGNLPPEAVLDWLHAADLFALATAREGCCNAVLEALATGLPVVTTPVGDNREFVGDGSNGYLVAVDDDRALAARLAEGLAREWDRAAISRALRAQVGDWEAVAGRVIDFFAVSLAQARRA